MIVLFICKYISKNTVPISQFNRGMAGKVFSEVKKSGPKVVIKNNEPICVIISPEEYVKLMEELEDAYLYMTSQDRLSHFKNIVREFSVTCFRDESTCFCW